MFVSVCRSVDIRNNVTTFQQLKGCRVVEGFVQILLFDKLNKSQLANICFPELVEITGYLLFYRVSGLTSLGQLFPNLAVIRGQLDITGYSFIVFEMPSLQEINLYSLTDISHGFIRIDKNPSLCFVNTIDWSLIARQKGSEHYINSVKPEDECPICPEEHSGLKCPKTNSENKINTIEGQNLCWNRDHCQKVCRDASTTCADDANKTRCDESCLGGCDSLDTRKCKVCKNFTALVNNEIVCLSHCPLNLYEVRPSIIFYVYIIKFTS